MEIPTGRCIFCGKKSSLILTDSETAGRVIEWMTNPEQHVQNALPELSADQRELLISGTHSNCWPEEPDE